MSIFKRSLIVGSICLVVGFILGLALPHWGVKKSAPLSSIDSQVTRSVVKDTAPVTSLDKPELKKRGMIDSSTAASVQKEVLATGTVKDDSGKRNISAVLDTKTGDTILMSKRPLVEWMNRNELGLGYGIGTGGIEKAVMYEHTFARIWELYGSAEARVTDPEKEVTRWSAMLWLKYHW